MPTPQDELVTLYENLLNKYQVTTTYSIGIAINPSSTPEQANLSADVLTLLKYLNNNQLQPSDFDQKTFLKIKVLKKSGDYVDVFAQDSDGYMAVFDEDELVNFLKQYTTLNFKTN